MFYGTCWRCDMDGPLHAITMLCLPEHEADLAKYRAQMADTMNALREYEQTRLDHIESCRWCAESADTFGRMPPMYRCPRFADAVLAMAAVGSTVAA